MKLGKKELVILIVVLLFLALLIKPVNIDTVNIRI